jgi:hydrogenase maturation protein HypF
VAAVMAEHGLREPVIGVAFDGTGYGSDGHIWGGEVFQADLRDFRRLAQLQYVPLPGGDLAARAPWRSALGYLSQAPHAAEAFRYAFEGVGRLDHETAMWQVTRNINSPRASSMGRLFDAAAAIIGLRKVSAYEGQAAMELESLAGRRPAREIHCHVSEQDGHWTVDPLPLLIRLGLERQRGKDLADLAADFHASIAWMTAGLVRNIAGQTSIRTVVLSGGVFQNRRLLESLVNRLREEKFQVYAPERLSPNDGAVSYGQAAIGAAFLAGGRG